MIDLSRDLQLNVLQNINIIVLDESGISSGIDQYHASINKVNTKLQQSINISL